MSVVGVGDLLVAAIAGALVVLCGAFYAALFAFARLYQRRDLTLVAYVFFGALVVCVLVLADALRLSGVWALLAALLLAVYLIAPHLIWKLSVATHDEAGDGVTSSTTELRGDR